MATVSISVTATGLTKTVTKTVSGPDLVRFLNAYRFKYQVDGGAALTDEQVIDAWTAEIFAEGKRYTREYERQQQAPAEIAFT
jgi:hypothetical protein